MNHVFEAMLLGESKEGFFSSLRSMFGIKTTERPGPLGRRYDGNPYSKLRERNKREAEAEAGGDNLLNYRQQDHFERELRNCLNSFHFIVKYCPIRGVARSDHAGPLCEQRPASASQHPASDEDKLEVRGHQAGSLQQLRHGPECGLSGGAGAA